MKPEDVNKLNKKNNIVKIYKYCEKCQQPKFVSNYVSKCPNCKSSLSYMEQPNINIPKCPTCGSANIKKISEIRRGIHAAAWGILSNTVRSQFECGNCGYKW